MNRIEVTVNGATWLNVNHNDEDHLACLRMAAKFLAFEIACEKIRQESAAVGGTREDHDQSEFPF